MLHFNRNDIHEWNISKEAFDAMVKDYGFKVDESKISMDALYTNAVANLRNDSEKTFKFLKQEKDTPTEVRDKSFEEKTKMENFFTIALMVEVAKLIDEKAVKIQVHAAHMKRAYLEFNDYMTRRAQEQESKLLANLSMQEAGLRLQREQEMALQAYKEAVGNKISNMKAALNFIDQQEQQVKADYDDALNKGAIQSFNEIKNLKNSEGKPFYEGIPEEQALRIHKKIMEGAILTERDALKKMETFKGELVDVRNEISILRKEIQTDKTSVPFEKNNDGTVSLSLNAQKKVSSKQNRLAKLEAREAALENSMKHCAQNVIEDLAQLRKDVAQAENVDINRLPDLADLKATAAYEVTSEKLNTDLDVMDSLNAQRAEIMAEAKELESEIRNDFKDNPDVDMDDDLAELSAMTSKYKKDSVLENESSVRARN